MSNEQELKIESLRRQLGRAEDDCNALENRLERLDAENRHLTSVANEAEAQLRRGAAERQDALEGLGDELANVKNAAAEALAERDRLRVQLQQNNPSSNFQVRTIISVSFCQQKIHNSYHVNGNYYMALNLRHCSFVYTMIITI